MTNKDTILSEIRRIAKRSGGRPPGIRLFARETGIGEHEWKGVFWRRWSEAQAEAGFIPNKLGSRTDDALVLERYLELGQRLDAIPVEADLELERRRDPSFPSVTVFRRLGDRNSLLHRAEEFSATRDEFATIRELLRRELREASDTPRRTRPSVTGYVYLIRSGKSYKIGRTNAAGRRLRELAIQLPKKPNSVHVIETDDPEGIEEYWHRRFAAKRREGDGSCFLMTTCARSSGGDSNDVA